MATPIDRTHELISALASLHGEKGDSPSPTILLKKHTPADSEFSQQARALREQLLSMHKFLDERRARYTDFSFHGMRDGERDDVDRGAAAFMKRALAQIDVLKEVALGGGGGKATTGRRRGAAVADAVVAHRLGVVVALNEELRALADVGERLRGMRVQHALRETRRGEVPRFDAAKARELVAERRREAEAAAWQDERDGGDGNGIAPDADGETDAVLQREFASENRTLVSELVHTRDRVRVTETTVLALAELNRTFATQVVEQAREVEALFERAVEADANVRRGNDELRKMKRGGPWLKYLLAALALLLAAMLVVAEWATRRRLSLLMGV